MIFVALETGLNFFRERWIYYDGAGGGGKSHRILGPQSSTSSHRRPMIAEKQPTWTDDY